MRQSSAKSDLPRLSQNNRVLPPTVSAPQRRPAFNLNPTVHHDPAITRLVFLAAIPMVAVVPALKAR